MPSPKKETKKENEAKVEKREPSAEGPSAVAKPKREKKEVKEEHKPFEWWKQEGDELEFDISRGGKKWNTLKHNGPLIAPPYEPHGIPIKYEGVEFKLTPEEEEIATMFAKMRTSDFYRNEIFRRNFFSAWKNVLYQRPEGRRIRKLELVSFDAIYEWYERERNIKKAMPPAEKKKLAEEAKKLHAPYQYCEYNGRPEEVANFRVEPPGLFRGRGKHPLMGCLKARVQPEDITINCSEGCAPPAPPGHKWKDVIHNPEVTWLAMWRDHVTDGFKYVMLASSAAVKGAADREKFEKARRLKDLVADIRESYLNDLKNGKDPAVIQRAVCMYFIDRLALRVGNEKDTDEADTVGCCSLRIEHVKPMGNNIVQFDFLGKDSIRYLNDVEVIPEVYAFVEKQIKSASRKIDDLFPNVSPSNLNEHLHEFMPGLSAKVFRTMNASKTLCEEFKNNPVDPKASEADKMVYFNAANTKVAILCNHQKTVSKAHEKGMFNLSTQAEHYEKAIERVKKAMDIEKKKGSKAAQEWWYAEEDQIQWEWLNAYGTEEDKTKYQESIDKRTAPKERKSTGGGSAKKRTKVEESSSSEDEVLGDVLKKRAAPKKKASPAKARKAPAKKRAKEVESSDSEEEDMNLGDMLKKKAKKEESESEEETLGAMLAKK